MQKVTFEATAPDDFMNVMVWDMIAKGDFTPKEVIDYLELKGFRIAIVKPEAEKTNV